MSKSVVQSGDEKIPGSPLNCFDALRALRPIPMASQSLKCLLEFSGLSAFFASRYSYRSATIGSTRAALLAGIQHASTPVASNNKTVLAKIAGSYGFTPGHNSASMARPSTAATLGIAAGVSVKVISDLLGHASISFTLECYSHVLPSIQDEAAAKVEKLLVA